MMPDLGKIAFSGINESPRDVTKLRRLHRIREFIFSNARLGLCNYLMRQIHLYVLP